MRRDITDAWLRGLKPPETGRLEIWDTREAGLVLRLTHLGVSSWSVRARTHEGKRTRPTLGTWPTLGIANARKLARVELAKIQGGADPVASKKADRAARTARAGLPTVADRLTEWREAKAAAWSDRYRREVERLCKTEIVPVIGVRALVETTRQDWTSLIATKYRRAPGVGGMLYRTASAFLNHAEAHGWIGAPLLPRKGLAVIAPPVPARERTLSDDELSAIWTAANGLRPKARAFVHLLAMTAAREIEVADIATGEIDLATATWSIPGVRTKNRRGIVLPLHSLLLNDLRAVWPVHGDRAGATWRLLGDIAGSGLRGFSKLKLRLDKDSGVAGWRWHDLRRTARTGMARLGVPRDHAEAALNHISGRSALERTYDRHDFAPEVAGALSRWQVHVATVVSETPVAETFPRRSSSAYKVLNKDDKPPDIRATALLPRSVTRGVTQERSEREPQALECRHPLVVVRRPLPVVVRRQSNTIIHDPDRDPPTSRGAVTEDKVGTRIWRVPLRTTPAVPPGQGSDEPSAPPAAVRGPSVTGKNDKLRAMIGQIPRANWELAEAAQSSVERQLFRQVRAAVATRTRREVDDDDLLLRIELYRRVTPGMSVERAVRGVTALLRTDDKPNQKGERVVKLGDRRIVSEPSAIKHLTQKFQKHEQEIVRRANGQDVGKKIAQQHAHRVAGPRDFAGICALASDLVSTMEPAALKKGRRSLDDVSLPDASDAFLRELRKR
jgi:hypothetical protein